MPIGPDYRVDRPFFAEVSSPAVSWPSVSWIVGGSPAVTLRLAHHGFWYGGMVLPPSDFYFRHVLAPPSARGGSGSIADGTSNTVFLGEQPGREAARRDGGIRDGTSNTFSLGEQPSREAARRGTVRDGTGNTVFLGEKGAREVPQRCGRQPGGSVRDGTSKTISLREQAARGAGGRGGGVRDGTSNTIGLDERLPVGSCGGDGTGVIADGAGNTLALGERARRRAVVVRMLEAIRDRTRNTITFDEQTLREAARRGGESGGGVGDGTSNTIGLGEQARPGTDGRGGGVVGGRVGDGTSNTIGFGEQTGRGMGERGMGGRGGDPVDGPVPDGTSNTILFGETDAAIVLSGWAGSARGRGAMRPVARCTAAGRIADALSRTAMRDSPSRLRHVRVTVDFGVDCVIGGGAAGRAGPGMSIHAWACGATMFDVFHCESAR